VKGPVVATPVALPVLLLAAITLTAACGKKGPPLQPLRLVPNPVSEVTARRSGQEVELRFALPTTNANGPGRIDLDRIEIYAITVAPGAVTPPNRELLTKGHVAGAISVKPPPVEGEDPVSEADKRPAPGDRVTFVEQLTEEKLKPVAGGQRPEAGGQKAEAVVPPDTPGLGPLASGLQATHPVRIYVARGISRAGRPGPPSPRVSVPLVSPMAPPSAVAAHLPTASAIVVDWTPPVADVGATPLTYNVYRPETVNVPMNPAPLGDVKFEVRSVEYGKEQCFVVRTVQTLQNVTIESDPTAPACLTPIDKFPPAAPKGVRAVAEDGAVNLVWEANAEPDLGGYLVLRGEVEGGVLPPITPKPIKDANFRDTTAKPGVRYFYAVVAVDTATPRNTSAESKPEAVTAR
jgi:hypothetical protein